MNQPIFDVIIIGGGPAGMSAALVLGRSRINTLVLNTEKPRNSVTTRSHGFLTRDGIHPLEMLGIAKSQLEKYASVTYKTEKVIALKQSGNGFEVEIDEGRYEAKRVVIATGHKDNIGELGIEGLDEVYGTSVYPCPFCDGFELADKKLAVIGDATMAPMFAKTIWHWSRDVMVFTNGEQVQDKTVVDNLLLNGISIHEQKIVKLHSNKGQLASIELANGQFIEREGGFLPDTKSTEAADFAQKLALAKEAGFMGMEMYKVDEANETEIKGLFLIGDAKTGWSGIAASVADGGQVAAAITHQIIEENWNQ